MIAESPFARFRRDSTQGSHYMWKGSPVAEVKGPISDVRSRLPRFHMRPFTLHTGGKDVINPRFSTVVLGEKETEPGIPVGVVSMNYQLVQHDEAMQAAVDALNKAGIDPASIETHLRITEYGERISLGLLFPETDEFSMNLAGPSDTMRLQLHIFNSVEGSMKFMAFLGWFRFICENGMILGISEVAYRRRHNVGLQLHEIRDVLSCGLQSIKIERDLYGRWQTSPVQVQRIRHWVDHDLKDTWGVKLAARTYHIARTGYDADFVNAFESGLPSEKTMKPTCRVPGSPDKADDVFAVSQILSWLAKERNDIQEQVERMRDIPLLVDKLMN
jgi:hypothetical protein